MDNDDATAAAAVAVVVFVVEWSPSSPLAAWRGGSMAAAAGPAIEYIAAEGEGDRYVAAQRDVSNVYGSMVVSLSLS